MSKAFIGGGICAFAIMAACAFMWDHSSSDGPIGPNPAMSAVVSPVPATVTAEDKVDYQDIADQTVLKAEYEAQRNAWLKGGAHLSSVDARNRYPHGVGGAVSITHENGRTRVESYEGPMCDAEGNVHKVNTIGKGIRYERSGGLSLGALGVGVTALPSIHGTSERTMFGHGRHHWN